MFALMLFVAGFRLFECRTSNRGKFWSRRVPRPELEERLLSIRLNVLEQIACLLEGQKEALPEDLLLLLRDLPALDLLLDFFPSLQKTRKREKTRKRGQALNINFGTGPFPNHFLHEFRYRAKI